MPEPQRIDLYLEQLAAEIADGEVLLRQRKKEAEKKRSGPEREAVNELDDHLKHLRRVLMINSLRWASAIRDISLPLVVDDVTTSIVRQAIVAAIDDELPF